MGRKKIKIERITAQKNRQVTFNKRKVGLMKKAMELSILCDCSIAVVIFSGDHLYEYGSQPVKELIHRYRQFDGLCESLDNNDLNSLRPGRASSFKVGHKKRKTGTDGADEDVDSDDSSDSDGEHIGPLKQMTRVNMAAAGGAAMGLGLTLPSIPTINVSPVMTHPQPQLTHGQSQPAQSQSQQQLAQGSPLNDMNGQLRTVPFTAAQSQSAQPQQLPAVTSQSFPMQQNGMAPTWSSQQQQCGGMTAQSQAQTVSTFRDSRNQQPMTNVSYASLPSPSLSSSSMSLASMPNSYMPVPNQPFVNMGPYMPYNLSSRAPQQQQQQHMQQPAFSGYLPLQGMGMSQLTGGQQPPLPPSGGSGSSASSASETMANTSTNVVNNSMPVTYPNLSMTQYPSIPSPGAPFYSQPSAVNFANPYTAMQPGTSMFMHPGQTQSMLHQPQMHASMTGDPAVKQERIAQVVPSPQPMPMIGQVSTNNASNPTAANSPNIHYQQMQPQPNVSSSSAQQSPGTTPSLLSKRSKFTQSLVLEIPNKPDGAVTPVTDLQQLATAASQLASQKTPPQPLTHEQAQAMQNMHQQTGQGQTVTMAMGASGPVMWNGPMLTHGQALQFYHAPDGSLMNAVPTPTPGTDAIGQMNPFLLTQPPQQQFLPFNPNNGQPMQYAMQQQPHGQQQGQYNPQPMTGAQTQSMQPQTLLVQ